MLTKMGIWWKTGVAGLVGAAAFMLGCEPELEVRTFELQRLEREIVAEQELHWDLRVDYARLQAPGRITQRAADLGLVYPDRRHTIEVPGMASAIGGPEDRWMDMRALFVERP